LKGTRDLGEQWKTREWLIGKIASITERVVEPNVRRTHITDGLPSKGISDCFSLPQVPDSDPYGFGDGVKYYMLEVDDWIYPSFPKRSEKTPLAAIERGETPME
jgi:autophagy-related protein 11